MNIQQLQNEFPIHVMKQLTVAIERAVRSSLTQLPPNELTQWEVKRRAQWCVNTAVMLRREMQWATDRICDVLPQALNHWLIWGEWEPPKRQVWAPDD